MSMSEVTPDGAAPSPAPSEVMTYRQQTVLLAPGPVETLEQPKNLVLIGSILTVSALRCSAPHSSVQRS